MNSHVILESKNISGIHYLADSDSHVSLTASELARARCESIVLILGKLGVEFTSATSRYQSDVCAVLRNHGEDIRGSLPTIWRERLLTSTYLYRKDDIMYYGESPHAIFHKNNFDYGDVSDGGVRVVAEDELDLNRATKLPWSEYLSAKGGDMNHKELQNHPIFRAIIPDAELRRWYVTCLRILDFFSIADRGKQSLWRPGEMKSGYLRWIALGIKGVAVYPPNVTTLGHKIICRRKPIISKS